MVTKEQCLLKIILNELERGGNERLVSYLLSSYNQGKKYVSEKIFPNTEAGFYEAFQGWGEMEICKIFYETVGDSGFDASAPFFTVDYKLNSLDADGFLENIGQEDMRRLLNQDVLEELDESDVMDAFVDTFIYDNYKNVWSSIDVTDVLYDIGYRNGYDILYTDWNQLVQKIQQYQPQGNLDETKTVRLTESDLRNMTNKILKEITKRNQA